VRRVVIAAVVALATGPAALGQTPQSPVFRGGVTLVTVDVTVLDRDGKPVPGLTAGDFEVKLDGHLQPVRAVDYEETATRAAPAAVNTAPRRETTNAVPPPDPRLFVILVDDLSIPATRDKDLFQAVSRFVGDLPANDVVGFTTSSGATTVNPTRDRAAVEAGLRRLSGQLVDPRSLPPDVPVGLDEAVEIKAGDQTLLQHVIARDCRGPVATKTNNCPDDVQQKVRQMAPLVSDTTERQVLSYLAVINAMRHARGQRFLVLLTDGLLVATRGKDQADMLEPIARAAAAAGVHLSVLFASPDTASAAWRSPADGEMQRADGLALMQGIETVADMTGGNFWRVMGQPDRFFGFVALATSGVYHLGIEAPAGSPPGRDFTLAARVKRSGLTVHANRVAVLPAPAVVVPVDEQLQTAVAKGAPNYGVPVAVATVVRRGETAAAIEVGANVEVPASAPGPLTVMFGLLDAAKTLRTGRKTIEAPAGGGAYRVSLSLPVAPGSYRLRFAVADATGQVGSIDMPVDAELAHVGPFLTSDVMTSWIGADGKPQFLALEAVPASATAINAFLELYAGSDAPIPTDVRVEWILLGDAVAPVADQNVVPARADDRLTAQTQFALGPLAPGIYTIKATVLVAGQAVGTVSTTIRKPTPTAERPMDSTGTPARPGSSSPRAQSRRRE
jgi:VWFA-related protein